ncbi:hypothetical protein C8J57DRAFT_1651241 [Mycena rebaudengoi]|nr:hypothetical protein C8J57DRAFT_1651241 [Mycena rebaudengoi]
MRKECVTQKERAELGCIQKRDLNVIAPVRQRHPALRDEDALRLAIEKHPAKFAKYLQNFLAWDNHSDKEWSLRIPSLCRGIHNLTLFYADSGIAPAVEAMQLRRLSVVLLDFLGGSTVDPARPLFRTLTHLDLWDTDSQFLTELPFGQFPALTHLSVNNLNAEYSPFLTSILRNCTRLCVLINMRLNSFAPGREAHHSVDDLRFVLVCLQNQHYVEDWKVGVEGGKEFWPHDIGFKTLISATEWPKGVAQIEKHYMAAATEDPFDMGPSRASRISAFFYPLTHFHVLHSRHSALHTDLSDLMGRTKRHRASRHRHGKLRCAQRGPHLELRVEKIVNARDVLGSSGATRSASRRRNNVEIFNTGEDGTSLLSAAAWTELSNIFGVEIRDGSENGTPRESVEKSAVRPVVNSYGRVERAKVLKERARRNKHFWGNPLSTARYNAVKLSSPQSRSFTFRRTCACDKKAAGFIMKMNTKAPRGGQSVNPKHGSKKGGRKTTKADDEESMQAQPSVAQRGGKTASEAAQVREMEGGVGAKANGEQKIREVDNIITRVNNLRRPAIIRSTASDPGVELGCCGSHNSLGEEALPPAIWRADERPNNAAAALEPRLGRRAQPGLIWDFIQLHGNAAKL